eukprot:TRINITY_DN984_c0_g1_i1.p1 TRINITY_DN984_c0_g1~~TRINITY_DN984_c0_g1_i1.p1  ORF type:complete len:590 (+),score=251.26 TRINITY_DN984_c0_g1_i1:159-1772(+)
MASQAMQMFRERLLRKAYRPGRRPADCPQDVPQCEEEFEALLQVAVENQPMDRGVWHAKCNEFSDKWEHICHWVHPSRLADSLTEQMELEWAGEYPARPEAGKAKAKVKSNVKAQRFKCPECEVECNSYAQYTIHAQGSKHLEMVEAVRQREAFYGRTYESPGAVPLDTEGAPAGASPQAYFKRDADAPAPPTPEKKPLAAKKTRKRAALMTTYATFLAMSTVSMATTKQQFEQDNGEFYEPSMETFGCWGPGCNTHSPYCLGVDTQDTAEGSDCADDDEDDDNRKKKQHKLGGHLNPDAEPFLGGRAYSLPTHDRWSDDSDSGSTAESTPAHSATRSSLSERDEEIGRLAQLIDLELQTSIRGAQMRDLRAADTHTLASALLHACGRHSPECVGQLVHDIGSEELNEVLGGDLVARMAAGARVVDTEAMDYLEAQHADEANTREVVAYSGALSLGMALCCTGLLTAELLGTALQQYVRNMTSADLLPPSASETALSMATKLSSKLASAEIDTTGFAVPDTNSTTPRRLRHILAALA